MVATGQLDTTRFVTYRFGPHEMVDAYDVFTRACETRASRCCWLASELGLRAWVIRRAGEASGRSAVKARRRPLLLR
jgi:hypothetical protein